MYINCTLYATYVYSLIFWGTYLYLFMNRPKRNIPRIDYREYNKTGIKTWKFVTQGKDPIMAETDLKDLTTVLLIKFDRLKEEYVLEDLVGKEETEKCKWGIKELKEQFVDTHVKLKRILVDHYKDSYESYEADVKSMKDWISEARREISKRKRQEIEELARKEEEKQVSQKGERSKGRFS